MKTYCNPLDLPYRYQHMNEQGRRYAFREGADPTLVYFKGTYYLFVSMSAGFFYSENLLDWRFHADPDLMIYDYAPDVRQVGDYLYFCASSRSKDCPILRSADPLHEKFEQVAAPFPFWDPDLFLDDDGRLYFYWGCTNTEPIWGVELDRETLQPMGEKRPLIAGDPEHLGYERPGENGVVDRESSVVYRSLAPLFNSETGKIEMPAAMLAQSGMTNEALTKIFLAVGQPYVEGAFMTKHDGRYYLQYAAPGTQYNTYADGVYVGQSPLGPFTRQASNPFSAVTGGFITGAGHGSTVADRHGNFWHAATMRISVNHDFERRVGLFPAGFDADGVLYCCFPTPNRPLPPPLPQAAARRWPWMKTSAAGGAPPMPPQASGWPLTSASPVMSAPSRSTWPIRMWRWSSHPKPTATTVTNTTTMSSGCTLTG